MYWRDYKFVRPDFGTLCLAEFVSKGAKILQVVTYRNYDRGKVWEESIGCFNDGKMTVRWVPLKEAFDRPNVKKAVLDEAYIPEIHPVSDDNFKIEIEKENEGWRDRLAVEYWQLTNRIGKLEKTLIKSDLPEDSKALLIEQRKAMLAYQDVLFRRCFHHNIDLYKHKFTE